MDTIKNYVLLALAALLVTTSLAALHYRKVFKATDLALSVQSAQIERTNDEAKQKLTAMTKERDALQASYDSAKKTALADKEKFDAELEKLRATRAAPGPVRVRLVPGSCAGGGSDAAQGGLRGDPVRGAEPQAAASGVLDPAIVGALDQRFGEVELLQRDFNTCRADLMGVRGIKE